ncbi:hypothetical protein KI387_022422, partial [Taxus chinensis]
MFRPTRLRWRWTTSRTCCTTEGKPHVMLPVCHCLLLGAPCLRAVVVDVVVRNDVLSAELAAPRALCTKEVSRQLAAMARGRHLVTAGVLHQLASRAGDHCLANMEGALLLPPRLILLMVGIRPCHHHRPISSLALASPFLLAGRRIQRKKLLLAGSSWILEKIYLVQIIKRVNMIVSALLTSVAINVCLCTLLVSLYSVLRKQPSNATVYAPRMVAEERAKQRGPLERFAPSAGWILTAWRASEDEILAVAGFDAYVFLRTFVFSLRIFSFSAAIGIFVLLPIHYMGKQLDFADIPNQSLDLFTIANVQNGSKRLWVHFCAVYLISGAACCLLYFENKGISEKRFSYFYSSPPQANHFTILVRGIPKFDQCSMSDTVEDFFTHYHPSTYLSHQMVYHTGKVQALTHEAKKLYKWVLHLKAKFSLQRHQQREGFFGHFGAKGDPVDRFTKKLEDVEEYVRLGQSEFYQKGKEIPTAFVSFKSCYGAAIAAQIPQSTNPLLWVTESAPEPHDVYWQFLSAPHLQRWIGRFVVMVAVFSLTIVFLLPVTFVQGLAQLSQLEKFLPFLKKVITT